MSVTAKQTVVSMTSALTSKWWEPVQFCGYGSRRLALQAAIEEAIEIGMELERKRIAAAVEESEIRGKLEKFMELCRQRRAA